VPELILRIVFKSGRVVEERGSEDMVELLFAGDELDLLDHILTIDQSTGQVDVFCEESDQRFNGMEVLMSNEVLKWNRYP